MAATPPTTQWGILTAVRAGERARTPNFSGKFGCLGAARRPNWCTSDDNIFTLPKEEKYV